jgi:hypothetical protein
MNVEYILKANFDNYQKGHFINTFLVKFLGKGFSMSMESIGNYNEALQVVNLLQNHFKTSCML